MNLTQLCLPRTFLDRIGFNEAIRKAIRIPTDPGLVQIFQKLAPNFDWAKARATSGVYQPPRWIGYWKTTEVYWASDGVLKLAIPDTRAIREVFEELRACHYAERKALPFDSSTARDPSHLVLHDCDLWRVYIAPFEHAEATLVRQPRPTC